VPTSGVAAIIGNLTSVDAHDAGWAAGFPAGTTFPGTSSLNNDRGGMVVPNHVFSPISARGLSVLTAVGGHVLLDVAGYVTGSATPATTPVPVNAMPIPRFPMTISIPAIGLTAALQADSQESDLKRGPGWWPGTSYPGVSGNMAVFGHRTEETAPFRLVNRLRAGDTISITGDHRRSVYEVDDWIVVPASRAEDFIGPFGGTMLTLIACSRPDGSVTSLAYRIIVRATLVDYSDA
jgi:LPXTG-site transpeptidase (sortase) family protein